MNIFSLRENKLGMTLVEMVISLVILGILMTSTMGMVVSSNNIFISTSKSAIDKQVGNYAFEFIEKALRYTTHMSIYNSNVSPSDSNVQSITISQTDDTNNAGKLMYKRADAESPYSLYEDSFYSGRSIQYSVHKVGNKNKHVKLKLTVFREGRAVYSRETIVKCLNLNLVAIGDGANPIVDKSSEDAVNQTITFSVDEQLLSGGKNAYSLEHKIAEFMGKYNKIQEAYVADLGRAQGAYITGDFNAASNPGIMNTGTTADKHLSLDSYITRMNAFNRAVFGLTGIDYSTRTPYPYDKDDISKCENLRYYYQQKIKDLLKFTPTAAGFEDGAFTTISVGNGAANYNSHTGNGSEFYGVVATKEELYLGFMLNYYDKNNDGVITKAEYPQFEGDTFFKGTSLDSYVKNTANNQMVIMCYFKDRLLTDDNYTDLIDASKKESVQTVKGEYNNAPVEKTLANSQYDFSDRFWGGNYLPSTYNRDTFYTFWSDEEYFNKVGNTGTLDEKINISTILNNIGATLLTPAYTGAYNYRGNIVPYNPNADLTYTAIDNLAEGWYYIKVPYYKDRRTTTYYAYNLFYINANANQSYAVENGKTIKFTFDNTSEDNYNRINRIVFQQATSSASGGEYIAETTVKNYTAHYYEDYVLYGVDWNSWFNANPSGLLNTLINAFSNFVNTIMGRTVNTNVTSISASNAVQSLGNRGQYTVSNISRDVASYNLAWTVYSSKRGTWYYVPARSTRLSGLASSFPLTSKKDAPTPIDADLDKGTWKSSTTMCTSIDTRKMPGSGFFGLVDTTSDVLWVALPTGNTIDLSTVTN